MVIPVAAKTIEGGIPGITAIRYNGDFVGLRRGLRVQNFNGIGAFNVPGNGEEFNLYLQFCRF
jgi:hypothetical protein